MSGPLSGLLGLDAFVGRGGGGGAPDLVPVEKCIHFTLFNINKCHVQQKVMSYHRLSGYPCGRHPGAGNFQFQTTGRRVP